MVGAVLAAAFALAGILWTQRQSDRRAQKDLRSRREDEATKEAWRRASDKRQRLAAEFERVLRGANQLAALVGPLNWTPANMRPPEQLDRINQKVTEMFGELQLADARLRLEGVPDVAQRMQDLAGHYRRFQVGLGLLGDPAARGGGVNFFDQLNVESAAIVAGRNELEQLLPQILAAILPDAPLGNRAGD